ncbi:MAG: phospholipase D-like domain-containing protein [candidate division WOR-3 bacterium]
MIIEVYFSGGFMPPESVIINAINNAQKTIDVSIYSFWGSPTADNIKNALINAKNRNVRIRVIAENNTSNPNSQSYPYILSLINNNIPVLFDSLSSIGYGCPNNSGYLNHQKFIVNDSQIVLVGSFNLTYNALNIDANDLLKINDRNLAIRFIKQFEMMWGSNGNLPNLSNCKFQNYKYDLMEHTFYYNNQILDSIKIFFSPKDGTYNVISNLIHNSQGSIYLAMNKFTLCDYRDSLFPKKNYTFILVDNGTWNDKPVLNIRGQNITPDAYCQNKPWNPPGNILKDNIPNNGILHYKFAIFDKYIVLTGSMNWTDNDIFLNDNNVVIIRSKLLANNYLKEFEQMFKYKKFSRRKEKIGNNIITIDGLRIENYFSPQDKPSRRIIEIINNSKKTIDFMAFSFTHDRIAKAIISAYERGVKVSGLFEKRQISKFSEYEKFKNLRMNVYLDKNPKNMHNKVIIIDSSIVITGSYNFSSNADNDNDENVLIIFSREIALKYLNYFNRLIQ